MHPPVHPQSAVPSWTKADRFSLYGCAGIAILAVLATAPWAETGINDDWSYAYTALQLARTGHFRFNGWATALVGVQAVWAAIFIRLFGFSFTLLRLTLLPAVAGVAVLIYSIGRRVARLSPSMAVFGTLTVVLSPVYLPTAASFMTDVPGLLFILAVFYLLWRSTTVTAGEAKRAMLASAAIALIGGTARQTAWLPALAGLPYAAWVWRRERNVFWWGLGMWAATGLGIWATLHYYAAQPYAVVDPPVLGRLVHKAVVRWALKNYAEALLTLLLLLVPVFAVACGSWQKRTGNLAVITALTVGLVCLLWGRYGSHVGWPLRTFPWMRNLLTVWGPLGIDDMLGQKPVVLAGKWRVLITALTAAATAGFLGRLASPRNSGQSSGVRAWHYADSAGFHACVLSLLFAAVYISALLPRVVSGDFFDRYLISLLPCAGLGVLCWCQTKLKVQRPPAAAWLLLGVYGCYGVATTHDYVALAAARTRAAQVLTAAGVPRTDISAGLEYDCWTQLLQHGYINDPRIKNPPGAFHRTSDEGRQGPEQYWMWARTPSVTHRYVVTASALPNFVDAAYGPVQYTTWLPPGRHELLIQQNSLPGRVKQ